MPEIGTDLTARQRELLTMAVEAACDGWGFPAIREIGEELGIRSTNGVTDHLKALAKKGYVEAGHRGDARGRRLTNKARALFGLPLLPLRRAA